MLNQPAARTLILGVGNLLVCDDGVGLRVLERLAATYDLPDDVQTLDGGTLGLDLLYYLQGVDNLLLIDALEMDEEPGTLRRLEGDEVPAFLSQRMSPHHIGVPDMLATAKLMDLFPKRIVLWGVQPGLLEMGLELSPPVAAQVDAVVEKVVAELSNWGVQVTPRAEAQPGPAHIGSASDLGCLAP
jgi:hydrogenase maturation protease